MDNQSKMSGSSPVSIYVVLILFSVVFLFPLYLAFVSAISSWYSVPSLLPNGAHWENFKYATTMIDFWRYLVNSIIICALVIVPSTLISGMVGYAFARITAPGRNAIFMLVLSTMMIPQLVTQIPMYILYFHYGIINTFIPFLIGGLGGNVFFIFLYRQFFSAVP